MIFLPYIIGALSLQLHITYLPTSERLFGRQQKSFVRRLMLVTDTVKATQRSQTMPFTVFRFGNFGLEGPPIWKLASVNCCWLGSESSPCLCLPEPSTLQIASRTGDRRLRKAANWASLRVVGEAGAVGGRRGFERLLESSVPHSYPSPGPCASASWKLRRLFVKRGRGSLALTPQLPVVPPRGYGPASRPTSRKPAAVAAEAAVATADSERTSRPEVRAVQAPSRRAPPSPPPSLPPPPAPPPPPLGPLLTEGGGEQNRTCAVRKARAKGGAWSTAPGRRRGLWALRLPDTAQTPQTPTAIASE